MEPLDEGQPYLCPLLGDCEFKGAGYSDHCLKNVGTYRKTPESDGSGVEIASVATCAFARKYFRGYTTLRFFP